MNQIRIGEFIASQRKDKKLTQAALAEKLGITDRAVSKQERGKGLPDASIILDLCEILGVSMTALLAGIFISAFLIPEGAVQLVVILGICFIFLIPCLYALKLEVSVGAYKCKNCGHEIVPTYSEALWAMHRGTTRHLKCPECKNVPGVKKF